MLDQIGTSTYVELQNAIEARHRRIKSLRYLEKGMSETDYDKLNSLHDELAPLKSKLRAEAAQNERGHELSTDNLEHQKLAELNEKVNLLIVSSLKRYLCAS